MKKLLPYDACVALSVLFFLCCPSAPGQRTRPTTEGIREYVESRCDSLLAEYESRVGTLYPVNVYTEDLSRWDDAELGEFYVPNEVVVTDEERFVGYEFAGLPRFKQRSMLPGERTVKGVVFHELTHAYFYKKVVTMAKEGRPVHHCYSYGTLYFLTDPEAGFGVRFVEEGLCEYAVCFLGEAPFPSGFSVPTTEEELLDKSMEANNVYFYSSAYLKSFLDQYGIERGTEILVTNRPPSYFEILVPRAFFTRLLEEQNP